jgi:hypothetical protein
MGETSPYNGIFYQPGNNYVVCDECGAVFRASNIYRRWDNALVCKNDLEIRHPQESLRGKSDRVVANKIRKETFVPIISDDCSTNDSWIVGDGWTHDSESYTFNHVSNTVSIGRNITDITIGIKYLIQVVIESGDTGELSFSFLNSTENGKINNSLFSSETSIIFTAVSILDTLILTPTENYNGKIKSITMFLYLEPIDQGDL